MKKEKFSLDDAISVAKSLQTEKIQFTEKEKRQIISVLIKHNTVLKKLTDTEICEKTTED